MSSGGSSARRHKGGHEEHEEHVNHERWLVSYADMLTLLFVLFVVLFSMSSVDMKKFARLADGLSQGFGAQSAAFSGSQSTLDGAGYNTEMIPIDPGANPGLGGDQQQTTEKGTALQRAAAAAAAKAKQEKDSSAAAKEAENLKKIEERVTDALARVKLRDSVRFTIDERGLVITVLTNEIIFAGNRAELQPGGIKILDAIAPTIASLPNNIQVDGHTNQLKVRTAFYPSGWELSTARSSAVVRELAGHGVAPRRMTASGYADTRPLIDPKDPRSIKLNRRVDVVVLSMLTADQRALLPAAAGADAKLHPGITTAEAAAKAKAAAGGTEPGTATEHN